MRLTILHTNDLHRRVDRLARISALVATGHLTSGLAGGVVTLGDLCRACLSPANPAKAQLKGEQILGMLRHGLNPDIYNSKPHAFRGQPQGILQVSGLEVHYDPAGASQDRVREVLISGETLDLRRSYTVSATDWEFSERSGYVRVPQADVTYEVPTVLREALQDYLGRGSPLAVTVGGRLVPLRRGS